MMNFNALDRYLDSFCSEKNVPGCGISVSLRGETVHTYTTGYADVARGIPFAMDTLLNLYSASKVSTVTAGMRLVERGLLDLGAPVARYLPEAAGITVRTEDGGAVPAQNTMLVEHLFSMSAGLTYDTHSPAMERLMQQTDGAPSLQQVAQTLLREPLAFEPGTRFCYSMCHDVLGAVMEAACGLPLDELMQKEVFDPLGMKDTTFRLRPEQRVRMAPHYLHYSSRTRQAESVFLKERMDMGLGSAYLSGGGGLISCVQDYAKLAAALANGGRLADGTVFLKPESIAQMQKNRLATEQSKVDFEQMGGWSKAGYGYGLGVRTLLDPERNNALSRRGEFGWDGMLGCYLLADPASGVGIFYAQHEEGTRWYEWHGLMRNLAYAPIVACEGC